MNELFIRKYPAVFSFDPDGISISFPDIPYCLSCAFSYDEAIEMATEALELALHGTPVSDIPNPSDSKSIVCKSNEKIVYITAKLEIKDGKLFSNDVTEF